MTLTELSLKDIRQIARLIERKETLRAQVEDINRALAGLDGTSTRADRAPEPRKAKAKKAKARRARSSARAASRPAAEPTAARNSSRKEQIINVLKGTGKEGVHVKEIAERIGSSKGSVNVWFYTVAKKVPNIQQTGPGKFRWVNGA